MESSLTAITDTPGFVGGRPLAEWNAAYLKVEQYFTVLRVKNRLLLGHLVLRVVDRAIRRAADEPQRSAMQLAGEEMDRIVTEWFTEVLEVPTGVSDPLLETRGRLALLLADMPGKWQDQFLKPGPWPEQFVRAMRESYPRAGPDFQFEQMTPRPIDLGPMQTLSNLGNLPYFRMVFAWLMFGALLTLLFEMTH
jgi:hypothetical protein